MSELLYRRHLYIDGKWCAPTDPEARISVISPVTQREVGSAPAAAPADVDAAVRAARSALNSDWRDFTPHDRAAVLDRAADLFQLRAAEIGDVITEENGSPVALRPILQVGPCVTPLRYYADYLRTTSLDELRIDDTGAAVVSLEPAGVVGIITPWNAPLLIDLTKIAPALAVGCTVVLKPAPETPLSAYLLAECLHEAGLPPGVFNLLPADRHTSESLVAHPLVDKIGFTGSTATGKRILELSAGAVRRVSLELGGKSAAVILDDADLDAVITPIVLGATMLSGQICAASTRILVPRSTSKSVLTALGDAVSSLTVGSPHDPDTWVGPLVAERQRDRVTAYIEQGIAEGARLVVGGGRPQHLETGWYVEPTVFADVDNRSTIAQEEIFGPVITVTPYDDDADAVALANDSRYGLAGSVWGGDEVRAVGVARRLRTGTVYVNGAVPAWTAPFGGFKESGVGREQGPEGLHEYSEYRTIAVSSAMVARLTVSAATPTDGARG
jgi:aldehyde dehydrogenase (NAD+)